jgi:hypothetical protein
MAFSDLGHLNETNVYNSAFSVWGGAMSMAAGADVPAGSQVAVWVQVFGGALDSVNIDGQPLAVREDCITGHPSEGVFCRGYIAVGTLSADVDASALISAVITKSGDLIAGMAARAFSGVAPADTDYAGEGPTDTDTPPGHSYTRETEISNRPRVIGSSGTEMLGPTGPMDAEPQLYLGVAAFTSVGTGTSRYFNGTTFTADSGWNMRAVTLTAMPGLGLSSGKHGFLAFWRYLDPPHVSNAEIVGATRNGSSTDALVYALAWVSFKLEPEPPEPGLGFMAAAADRFGHKARACPTPAGGIAADRFDHAFPQAVAASLEIAPDGVTGASMNRRPDGVLELEYVRAGDVITVYSRDGGRSWG